MTKPAWSPPTQYPDPSGQEDDVRAEYRFTFWIILVGASFMAGIIALAIISANTPDFYDRCKTAGGVVVGDTTCVHKNAIIGNP